MEIFESENQLTTLIEQKKKLLVEILDDKMPLNTFYKEYGDFYSFYALDGHESDTEEFNLLLKYDRDIELFRIIDEEIFNRICSDEDAIREIYIHNGRISRKRAIEELKIRRKELGI
jgi:hypothetical protein